MNQIIPVVEILSTDQSLWRNEQRGGVNRVEE